MSCMEPETFYAIFCVFDDIITDFPEYFSLRKHKPSYIYL